MYTQTYLTTEIYLINIQIQNTTFLTLDVKSNYLLVVKRPDYTTQGTRFPTGINFFIIHQHDFIISRLGFQNYIISLKKILYQTNTLLTLDIDQDTYLTNIFYYLLIFFISFLSTILVVSLLGPTFNHNNADHNKQLLSTARQSKLMLKIINGAALLTCFLWVLYPYVLHLQGKTVQFSIWLPYDYNISSR